MDTSDLTSFIDYWVYDIERRIYDYRDSFKEDLDAHDDAIRRLAEDKVSECCEWLCEPTQPVTKEERQKLIEESLKARGIAALQARAIAKQGSKVTGRSPGAPRTTGRQAIRALTLHLTTDKSYREIALMMKGQCEHVCPTCGDAKRPEMVQSGIRMRKQRPRCSSCECTIRPESKKEQVCSNCAGALRQSILRLEAFLHREGLHPNLPRRTELDRMSREELEQVWQSRE